MNERIKELYTQACVDAKNKFISPEEIMDFANYVPEKFAELIVKDCLTICDAVGTPGAGTPNCEAGGQVCAEMIRENFGVKA